MSDKAVRVQHIDGVLLSWDSVADLIDALDLLSGFAGKRGARLRSSLVALREELVVSTRVSTRVDASTRVVDVLEVAYSEDGLIDTAAAARRLDIREDTVRYLCRHKRLPAMRVQGRWWIPAVSVEDYRQSRAGRVP